MNQKSVPSTWLEKLWAPAIGLNILVTLLGFPYGLSFFALGMAQQSQACYSSGIFNLIIVLPLAIALASIVFVVLSWRSHAAGRQARATWQAFFPVAAYVGHIMLYRLSPCWG